MVADGDQDCCICCCLDKITLRIDLFSIDVQEVKTVNNVPQKAKESSCDSDQWNRSTKEDADGDDGESLRVKISVVEVILLLAKPWLVILKDLAAHICEPRTEVRGKEVANLEQVEGRGVDSGLKDERDEEHAVLTHVELAEDATYVPASH